MADVDHKIWWWNICIWYRNIYVCFIRQSVIVWYKIPISLCRLVTAWQDKDITLFDLPLLYHPA